MEAQPYEENKFYDFDYIVNTQISSRLDWEELYHNLLTTIDYMIGIDNELPTFLQKCEINKGVDNSSVFPQFLVLCEEAIVSTDLSIVTTAFDEVQNHLNTIDLIKLWLSEDSDYDKKTWPKLKVSIDENRLSMRRRFRD